MSVKKHYETRTHEVTESVLVGETLCCDICGKEVGKSKGYWKVTTGHNDWGNDSIESIEQFDVCSDTCLKVKFVEYIDESDVSEHNTRYINVEREYWW